jgi:hypothetical protein
MSYKKWSRRSTASVEGGIQGLWWRTSRTVIARCNSARRLPELLADLVGRVDLVVTSPPYACEAGVIDKPEWRAGQPLCPKDMLNYSRDPANLGRARDEGWRAGIRQVLAG